MRVVEVDRSHVDYKKVAQTAFGLVERTDEIKANLTRTRAAASVERKCQFGYYAVQTKVLPLSVSIGFISREEQGEN